MIATVGDAQPATLLRVFGTIVFFFQVLPFLAKVASANASVVKRLPSYRCSTRGGEACHTALQYAPKKRLHEVHEIPHTLPELQTLYLNLMHAEDKYHEIHT